MKLGKIYLDYLRIGRPSLWGSPGGSRIRGPLEPSISYSLRGHIEWGDLNAFCRTLPACLLLLTSVLMPATPLGNVGIALAGDDVPIPPDMEPGKVSIAVASREAPISELSWTSGEPFPVVNGQTIFPPIVRPYPENGTAVSPSPNPPNYAAHWYAGSEYTRDTRSASWMKTKIKVPATNPLSDEFYYVLLSAWDIAGSYDQIGFSDTWGVWGLTYSWTSGACTSPTYHYSSNAMALSLGVTYKFYIGTPYSDGYVWFLAFVRSTIVWYLVAPTGGTALTVANSYCGSYDYTDYEEIWYTHALGGAPMFTFKFAVNEYYYNNRWRNARWSAWKTLNAPVSVQVLISREKVAIRNPLQ